MNPGILILILIGYSLLEFINSIFFNWKLYLLSEKKFNAAGMFGAISTILFVGTIILASWAGFDQETGIIVWWIIPFVAVSMGLGNFLAALLVPKIRNYLESKREKNSELKK